MRRRAGWAPTAAVLAAVVAAAGCGGDAPAPPASGAASDVKPFPLDFVADRICGGQVALADFRGDVVLVHLFSTATPEGVHLTPVLVSLYARYRAAGFDAIGLAYERAATEAEAREAVGRYAQAYTVPYVLALGTRQVQAQLPHGRLELPTVLLVDRQGYVRQMYTDYKPGDEAALAEQIEHLLAEPAAP